VPDLERRFSDLVAERTSRRGFLDRVGQALFAATAGSTVSALVAPGEAEAFHFCGHTFTTGSCHHPVGLPRVDAHGFPLRARDGKRVDDLGRVVDRKGRPIDAHGQLLRDTDGNPLPRAPRTRICRKTARRHHIHLQTDGAWYRCCGGHVRKLMDCCGYIHRRINGDAALTGYCFRGRKVFCVQYYQTKVPC
jgi:hypothetical protein